MSFGSLLALSSCSSGSVDAVTTSTAAGDASTSQPTATDAPSTTAAPTIEPTPTTAAPVTNAPTTAVAEAPAPDGLRHLVSGHNDPDADRINLVIASWGWDDPEAFEEVARMYIGWDERAQLHDNDGLPVADPQDADWAELGLFGWEPFRSNKARFNVWVTDESPETPLGWLGTTEPKPVDLGDLSYVTLALDADVAFPGINSVAGPGFEMFGRDPQRRSDDSVGNAMVLVYSSYPVGKIRDLPHELGHALFGLADEYVGRAGGDDAGVARESLWPSCAADLETAEAWWGDSVGEVDPMVRLWADEMAAAGFPQPDEPIARFEVESTVDFIEGGCHGDLGSYRIVDETMMGFTGPGFGLANTTAAQNILDLFEGK